MRGEDDNNIPHALTGGQNTAPPSQHKIFQDEIRRQDHGYFESKDFSQAVIVGHYAPAQTGAPTPAPRGGTSNIEVIALATDRVKGDWDVGIRSIEFSATGKLVGKTIPTVRPFDYVYQFVWDPNQPASGIQDYDALRISDLTRVAYQNDYRSPSNADTAGGPLSYFHHLTNTDGANTIIDFADRNRYWRSKVTQGAAWNDINSTEAVNNAKGAFPDDYYTFTVTARDAAGNSSNKAARVLLDNWVQTITTVLQPRQTGDPLNLYRFRASGTNWTAGSKVPLYIVSPAYAAGTQISTIAAAKVADLVPDANGTIPPTDFTYLEPDPTPKAWHFMADYHNGDDIYQPQLDAVNIIELQAGGPLRPGAPFTITAADWYQPTAVWDGTETAVNHSKAPATGTRVAAGDQPTGPRTFDQTAARPQRSIMPGGLPATAGPDDPIGLPGGPI
jgi:hypothetical protein